jgi:subtilisin-like proprotein convertase family protein
MVEVEFNSLIGPNGRRRLASCQKGKPKRNDCLFLNLPLNESRQMKNLQWLALLLVVSPATWGQSSFCLIHSSDSLLESEGLIPDDWIANVQENCFTDTLTITGFPEGVTWDELSPEQQILGVNLEHSFVGDLIISFTCPDESTVVVHESMQGQSGGNINVGVSLGFPSFVEGEAGTGSDYFWSPSGNASTLAENAINGIPSIPSGTYQSDNGFSALDGCPANGDWVVTICDTWNADDGYVFQWNALGIWQEVIDCAVGGDFAGPYASCTSDGWIEVVHSMDSISIAEVQLSQGSEVISTATIESSVVFDELGEGEYTVELWQGDTVLLSSETVVLEAVFHPSESDADEICSVEFDQAAQRNKVIWTKSDAAWIASYNVYRESVVTSDYDWIGNVHADSLSEFLDLDFDPASNSTRYNLIALDSCDAEVDNWPVHRTIHLQASLGVNDEVNLYWNAYEGISYPNFEVHRSTDGVNYFQVGMVSNTTFAYTDLAPPSGPKWYQIRITLDQPCEPIRSFVSSFIGSNISDLNANAVEGATGFHSEVESRLGQVVLSWSGWIHSGWVRCINQQGACTGEQRISGVDGTMAMEVPAGIWLVQVFNEFSGQTQVHRILVLE